MSRGDLADSSIFASEDAGGEAAEAKRLSGSGGGGASGGSVGADGSSSVQRDPTVMAAVLDPQPDARRRWERKMLIRHVRRHGDAGGPPGCRYTRAEWLARSERVSVSASHFLPTSVKKLGALARQIAGKPLDNALVQMRFSPKRAAREVKAHLEHARNEAVVRRGMGLGGVGGGVPGAPVEIELKTGRRHAVADRSALYIDQAWVGRGPYTREPEPRAMGRQYMLMHPSTSMSFNPSPPPPPLLAAA